METNQDNQTNHSDVLKHVLCGALVHLQAIATEIKKLDIKPDPKDNDKQVMQRATILHLTMVAINDIIHPAHNSLFEYFKGQEEYFNVLMKAWQDATKDKMNFIGCMCSICSAKKD